MPFQGGETASLFHKVYPLGHPVMYALPGQGNNFAVLLRLVIYRTAENYFSYAPLAQMEEHSTFNRDVMSSSLIWGSQKGATLA